MTKAQYLSWFDEVLKPTEPVFRRVPSDKLDFKLTERSFSVRQQLGHITGAFAYMAKVINREELPYKSVREILVANKHQPSTTVEVGVESLKRTTTLFKQAVEKLTEEQFQNELIETPQLGSALYWRYCAFALEHHIHHLMELHICLKMLTGDANTKTLYFG